MGEAVAHHAPSHLDDAVLGLGGEDPDVALEGQGQSHPDGMAVDGGDDQLPHLPGRHGDRGGAEGISGGGGEGFGPGAEIGTGAEGGRGPGDHHRPHPVVLIATAVGISQLIAHAAAEGIANLRAVEGDGGDPVVHGVEDGPVGHRNAGAEITGEPYPI